MSDIIGNHDPDELCLCGCDMTYRELAETQAQVKQMSFTELELETS